MRAHRVYPGLYVANTNSKSELPIHNIFCNLVYDTNAGISLRKRTDRLEVSRITLNIPIALASKIFIETGDLPVNKYPRLEELAEIIAKVLNIQEDARSFAPSEAMLCGMAKQE